MSFPKDGGTVSTDTDFDTDEWYLVSVQDEKL